MPAPELAEGARHLEALAETYRERGVCLLLGSGASLARGWDSLLREVHRLVHRHPGEPEAYDARLKPRHPAPWDRAQAILEESGLRKEEFANVVRTALLGEVRPWADRTHRRLPPRHLRERPTLDAAIAFCSRIRAIRRRVCLEPNRGAVHGVLTLNYDCSFEAGATRKHEAFPFRPVSRTPRRTRPGQIHVHHLHGYVPYDPKEPIEETLVLTAKAYQEAYDDRTTFTSDCITRLLGAHPTLFVGTSLHDERLLERLDELGRAGGPTHYALMGPGWREALPPRVLERVEGLRNLRVIGYRAHEQVPDLLGHVYQRGLEPEVEVPLEAPEGALRLPRERYWQLLRGLKASRREAERMGRPAPARAPARTV